MPIYEFECKECMEKFEELASPTQTDIKCPKCGSERVEKLFSPFSSSSGSCGTSSGST